MADEDHEKDGPSLELPSLGFRRKRRAKSPAAEDEPETRREETPVEEAQPAPPPEQPRVVEDVRIRGELWLRAQGEEERPIERHEEIQDARKEHERVEPVEEIVASAAAAASRTRPSVASRSTPRCAGA